MGKVKATEIRDKSRADLLAKVSELKKELSTVRPVVYLAILLANRSYLFFAAACGTGDGRCSIKAC